MDKTPLAANIYTPADGTSWRIARSCVLVAHNTYQEVVSHLALTHLMSEAVMLATIRNLAATHPISVLLRRHFEGTLYVNKLAVELLIQPGRAVEYLIGSDLPSTYPRLAKHRRDHSFRNNYLPARFESAGTAGSRELPVYPYRDDGLLVWHAIGRFVVDFVEAYYPNDDDVVADHELQGWATEVASPANGQVHDFGATPGHICDRQDLAEILTMVVWTAGPQHAAVNFAQKEHFAFLPANPLAGYTPEPTGRDHTEADWLANLPPIDVAVQQMCIMTFLGSIHHTSLGDYGDDFVGTAGEVPQRRFVAELATIEDEVKRRNQQRPVPYEHLRPSLIPNSTNI